MVARYEALNTFLLDTDESKKSREKLLNLSLKILQKVANIMIKVQ